MLDSYKWVPANAGIPVMTGDSMEDCIVELLAVPRVTKCEGVVKLSVSIIAPCTDETQTVSGTKV